MARSYQEQLAVNRASYAANIVARRQRSRDYAESHKEGRALYKRARYQANADLFKVTGRVYHRHWRQTIRDAVFARYGEFCARCGFTDRRALQIDHVNGGGAAERKVTSERTFLNRVLEDTEGTYQILCANCNQIKRHENKEGVVYGS